MTTASTPAGWYPDPGGSGGQRYWDGFGWTQHRSPAPAPPAAPGPPDGPRAGAHRALEPESEAEPAIAPQSTTTARSPGPPDNRKLVIGFLSAVGALLAVLVLVLVYAFAIRDDTGRVASPGSSTSSTAASTSSQRPESTTASDTPTGSTPPSFGEQATEGDFAFSVASTDSGDAVRSPINEYIEKTATGQFIVVYLDVGNRGSQPLTFLSTPQRLNTDAGTFTPDDEASFYLGGGVVTIEPGQQVETAVAFDVPVGTTPRSIQVHGEPGGAGVELPL